MKINIKIIAITILSIFLILFCLVTYFIFQTLIIKDDLNYDNLEEIPYVNWYSVRSGVFGAVLKIKNSNPFKNIDSSKYITIIPPNDDKFKPISGIYTLDYFGNGVEMEEMAEVRLYSYTGVYRTKFGQKNYLLFAQHHIQKNKSIGLLLVAYPIDLLGDKTLDQFIKIATTPNMFAPNFSPIYKFEVKDSCLDYVKDNQYCGWFTSKQKSIEEIIKKWGETGITPFGILIYPLVLNTDQQ